ncbi:AAA family ATPase, partial [Candidatus Woesearchaeota archaeon CG08_land_8_20_14_0_20_43_7]
NERIADNKKIYCADVGIRNVTVGFKDLGAVYENMVYLEIKNKSPRYIKESGIELDFRFDDTVIEAKYNSKINEKQEALMQKIKIKNKIIANGVEFFLK